MKTLKFTGVLLAASLLGLASGCNKDGAGCLTSTGPVTTETRVVPPFDSLILNDNVSLFLTYDSNPSPKVSVEAGSNLLKGITTEVVNGELIIHNLNTCNWVRSFDKPVNVFISCNKLWRIRYNSAGDFFSRNTLLFDSLKVEVLGGCGSIDLDLNTVTGYFIENYGTVDFRLHGSCQITSIYTASYGPVDCSELFSNYCFITSLSSNDCRVQAKTWLDARIQSIGNIYYTGNPDSVSSRITGQGKLIRY